MVAGTAAAVLQDLPAHPPGLRVPPDPGDQLRRLDPRLPADQAGERRGAEELLPHRAALGLLGADLREVPRRGSRVSRRTAISGATCSTSPSAWSGRPAWSPRPIYLVIQHWTEMWISAGGVRGHLADPEVHLVRPARPGRDVSGRTGPGARRSRRRSRVVATFSPQRVSGRGPFALPGPTPPCDLCPHSAECGNP